MTSISRCRCCAILILARGNHVIQDRTLSSSRWNYEREFLLGSKYFLQPTKSSWMYEPARSETCLFLFQDLCYLAYQPAENLAWVANQVNRCVDLAESRVAFSEEEWFATLGTHWAHLLLVTVAFRSVWLFSLSLSDDATCGHNESMTRSSM